MKHAQAPIVCSIGSVDPTGAAGIIMDMRVYAHLGAIGLAVVAAVTAQNSRRVTAIEAVSPSLVTRQLEALFEQVTPDAVCIGLVPSAQAMDAVRRFLDRRAGRLPIVIDPVIAASSGRRFLAGPELRALARLLPLATIVTPNLSEASALSGRQVTTLAQARDAARALAQTGCAVLVTGGHLPGATCVDVLAQQDRVRCYGAQRIRGSMRGAGGIVAAAIAVELARGAALEHAVARARRFVRRAQRSARRLGSGRAQFSGW